MTKRKGKKSSYKYNKMDYSSCELGNVTGDDVIGRDRTMAVLSWIFFRICKYPVMFIDFACCKWFQFSFYIYWKVFGRLPEFLEKYGLHDNRIKCLQNSMTEKDDNVRKLRDENCRLVAENGDLRTQVSRLQDEKQDALTRLSELASVKLRDNNPNIVDLNDPWRPTKIGEMFSELYDNEWTNAFSVLEDSLGEERAIYILLHVVMVAYGYCEERTSSVWKHFLDWIVNMNLPGAQQTVKWLKDSRKSKIRNKVSEVQPDYEKKLLESLKEENVESVAEFLPKLEMKQYISKCLELCLLMVTTDPPVVLYCPCQSNKSMVDKLGERVVNEADEGDNPDLHKDGKEPQPFDNKLFKEYTTRGRHVHFFVWPALFLKKDGALLSKGIAQGRKEP